MRYFVLLTLLMGCATSEDGNQKAMDVALDSALELPASDDAGAQGAQDVLPPQPQPESTTAALPADGTTEQTIQTIECSGGGTVRVTIRRERAEDPYLRKGYLRWEYDECGVWPYGVIDGTASYTRETEGGPPWDRTLRYHADLEYGGGADGECKAYVQLDQVWQTSDNDLELGTTCPHPVREWWDRLGITG